MALGEQRGHGHLRGPLSQRGREHLEVGRRSPEGGMGSPARCKGGSPGRGKGGPPGRGKGGLPRHRRIRH